jgi:predicted GIY-YIG superfamily endonuclease
MREERDHRYSVYILGSLSGTLYIGVTSNLLFRVRQHKEHTFRGFTAKYDVDRLLYYEIYGVDGNRSRKTIEELEAGEEDCAD